MRHKNLSEREEEPNGYRGKAAIQLNLRFAVAWMAVVVVWTEPVSALVPPFSAIFSPPVA